MFYDLHGCQWFAFSLIWRVWALRYIRVTSALQMRYNFDGCSSIYKGFIGFHLYLLLFFDLEGLGTALHPRYKCVTSALQKRYTFDEF